MNSIRNGFIIDYLTLIHPHTANETLSLLFMFIICSNIKQHLDNINRHGS